jgi:surfeit locus 1 family protein
VKGVIRLPQSKPDFGRLSDPTPVSGGELIHTWNLANLEQMSEQMPYPLVGVYIQASPDPVWTRPPFRTAPDIDLTEGSHLSYALQWFTFAVILAVGYPFYILREERGSQQKRSNQTPGAKQLEEVV